MKEAVLHDMDQGWQRRDTWMSPAFEVELIHMQYNRAVRTYHTTRMCGKHSTGSVRACCAVLEDWCVLQRSVRPVVLQGTQ